MSIKPTENYVLIRLETPDTVSEGGIILPEDDYEQDRGTIEAIGMYANQTSRRGWLKKGLSVIFEGYTAHEVEEGLVLVKLEHIMAVVE